MSTATKALITTFRSLVVMSVEDSSNAIVSAYVLFPLFYSPYTLFSSPSTTSTRRSTADEPHQLYTNTTTFKSKVLYSTTLTYTSTIRAAKSEFPITKSSKPTYLAEPGSNWATAYAALELFFREKTGRAFHDVVDGGSRVVGKGWHVKAKGLARLVHDDEMGKKEDEEEEDEDVEGVLDESEDGMSSEVDYASEEYKSRDDESMHEQTEMEIANGIKQQIALEEEEMEKTQQSNATNRKRLISFAAEPDDSDSDLSTLLPQK